MKAYIVETSIIRENLKNLKTSSVADGFKPPH